MTRGEPRCGTDGIARALSERRAARHEGFPVDAARRLGMRPVVSVPGDNSDFSEIRLHCFDDVVDE